MKLIDLLETLQNNQKLVIFNNQSSIIYQGTVRNFVLYNNAKQRKIVLIYTSINNVLCITLK